MFESACRACERLPVILRYKYCSIPLRVFENIIEQRFHLLLDAIYQCTYLQSVHQKGQKNLCPAIKAKFLFEVLDILTLWY